MTQLHTIGAAVVLVATGVFFVFALFCARTGRMEAVLANARKGMAALLGLEVLFGLVLLVQGSRPREGLHFLYGAVALGALPMASAFAAEAPGKARAGALAAGAGLLLIMIWRLWVTGGG